MFRRDCELLDGGMDVEGVVYEFRGDVDHGVDVLGCSKKLPVEKCKVPVEYGRVEAFEVPLCNCFSIACSRVSFCIQKQGAVVAKPMRDDPG